MFGESQSGHWWGVLILALEVTARRLIGHKSHPCPSTFWKFTMSRTTSHLERLHTADIAITISRHGFNRDDEAQATIDNQIDTQINFGTIRYALYV
jgi:hypothetical protein